MAKTVGVVADWDADGVVSAAEILYAQEKLGVFPVSGRAKVELVPAGPRSIVDRLRGRCWDVLVILDIPFTEHVAAALRQALESGCRYEALYYFDHHESTIENMYYLEKEFKALVFVGRSPTSSLVKSLLDKLGVRLTPRIKEFVSAVDVLEGRRAGREGVPQGMVRIAASISKHLNQCKSDYTWSRYVRWIANPLPFDDEVEAGSSMPGIIAEGIEASKTSDEELKEAATDLAMSAKSLGYIKLVDARGRWRKRGSSALASAIHKIVKTTVALVTDREDGTLLLVVRSSRGEAGRIMKALFDKDLVQDIGGHGNIGVARVKSGVTIGDLERALARASFETALRR